MRSVLEGSVALAIGGRPLGPDERPSKHPEVDASQNSNIFRHMRRKNPHRNAMFSSMPENVYAVRVETGEADETYRYLVGIECGLHQLTKSDSAQRFAQNAFLARYTTERQITIYIPEPYAEDALPDLPKVNEGCDCWTMELSPG
jgi:hypothetical protein